MHQVKSHQERYEGWDASPAVYKVHTLAISIYCTLMVTASGAAADGLREIIAASLIVFK